MNAQRFQEGTRPLVRIWGSWRKDFAQPTIGWAPDTARGKLVHCLCSNCASQTICYFRPVLYGSQNTALSPDMASPRLDLPAAGTDRMPQMCLFGGVGAVSALRRAGSLRSIAITGHSQSPARCSWTNFQPNINTGRPKRRKLQALQQQADPILQVYLLNGLPALRLPYVLCH